MQRLINPGDLKLYVVTAFVLAVLTLAAAGILRLANTSFHKALSITEWKMVGKIFAVLVLALILFLRLINAELPPQLFLYGRF